MPGEIVRGSLDVIGISKFGDGGSNYTQIAANGKQTMAGTARVTKCLSQYAYNIAAIAGTYNGIVCTTSTTVVYGGGLVVGRTFATASVQCLNLSFYLPTDYEDGTDITIKITRGNTTNTGTVKRECGLQNVSVGDAYATGAIVYKEPAAVAVPGTAEYQASTTFEAFSGASMVALDEIDVVVLRDTANDTATGSSFITMVELEYTANKLGA